MSEPTEALLIHELKQRNKTVFEKVYEQYFPRLVAFAQGYLFDQEESEGLVQKYFTYLWFNISDLNIQTSLKAYLFASVKNRCLNHIRDLKISDQHKLQYIQACLNSHSVEDTEEEPSQVDEALMDAIEKLPPQIKEILLLKYFKGKKQKEIAEILGVTENTIKTQIKRGKRKLKSILSTKLYTLLFF